MMRKVFKRFACIAVAAVSLIGSMSVSAEIPDSKLEQFLLEKNFIESAGDYKPEIGISRAEFFTWIAKAMELAPKEYKLSYSDVRADDAFAGYLQAVYEKNLIPEDMIFENMFEPEYSVTKEEMAYVFGKITNDKYALPDLDLGNIVVNMNSYSAENLEGRQYYGSQSFRGHKAVSDDKPVMFVYIYQYSGSSITYNVTPEKSGYYDLYQRDTFYRESDDQDKTVGIYLDDVTLNPNSIQGLYSNDSAPEDIPYRKVAESVYLAAGHTYNLKYNLSSGVDNPVYYLWGIEFRGRNMKWEEQTAKYEDDEDITEAYKEYVYCAKYHNILGDSTVLEPLETVTYREAAQGLYNYLYSGFTPYDATANISRAGFIKWAAAAMGLKNAKYTSVFNDVSENDSFAEILQAAYNSGIIPSAMTLDGSFKPNSAITKEEAAAILGNMVDSKYADNKLIDIDMSVYTATGLDGRHYYGSQSFRAENCTKDNTPVLFMMLYQYENSSVSYTFTPETSGYYNLYQRDTFYNNSLNVDKYFRIYINDEEVSENCLQNVYSSELAQSEIKFRKTLENVYLEAGNSYTLKYVLRTGLEPSLNTYLFDVEFRGGHNWSDETVKYSDDASVNAAYKNSIYCAKHHLMLGDSAALVPKDNVTQGEAAQFFNRFMNYDNKTESTVVVQGNTASAHISIGNSFSGVVAVAVYDDAGNLIGFKSANATLQSSADISDIAISGIPANAKAILWDSLKGMNPAEKSIDCIVVK